jgi:ATP-binding cassette subfamily B protein
MSDVTNSERPKSKSVRPLRALLPYLMPYKGLMVGAAAALLVASGSMLALAPAFKNLIDLGMQSGNAGQVDRYFIAFLCVALLFGVFAALRFYLVTWLGERVVADIRDKVYRRIIRMDPTFFEVTRTGEVLSRLTTDTTLVQSIAGVGLSITLRSAVQLVGALVLLAMTNARMLGMTVVGLLVVLVPVLFLG